PNTLAELKSAIDQTIDIIQKATDEIKAIPAPTIDKSTLDAWFTENTKAVDIAKQISTAASQNDDNKAGSLLDQLDSQSTTVDSKADAYGFKDCGSQGA
ncbi:MAG: hypothetical protein QOG03_488, partial [Actinomycetota bacterium]|nr:hypothetical protein [Actinomycetota bacterium]